MSEFYDHEMMADGKLNFCKECVKARVQSRYVACRVEISAYEAQRQRTASRRAKKAAYGKAYRGRNPQKAAARNKLGNAIRDGKIKRQPCIYYKTIKSQGHHTDYSKPLEVVWCCFKCHREREHGQVVTSTFL